MRLRLWHKIGGGYLLVVILLVVCGMAGFYGIGRLSESLDYLSTRAWDTADGSMEARIQILTQMDEAHDVIGDIDVEDSLLDIAEAKSWAEEAIRRFSEAKVASDEDIAELQQSFNIYEDKLDAVIESYMAFAAARQAFEENSNQLVSLGVDMENLADTAIETLQHTPDKELTWRGELEDLWDAADGGMETYIGLLQQLHYLDEMTDGADIQVTKTQLNESLAFQEEAVARMMRSGTFDVPAGSAYPGKTMAQAYAELLTTHKQLLTDYVAKFEQFAEDRGAYEAETVVFVSYLNSVEDIGDAAVEGEVENIAIAQRSARIIMAIALAIGVVAAAVTSVLLTQGIVRPVNMVAQAANRIASGDVEQAIEYRSGDEIGMLADAFRRMITYQQTMAAAAAQLAQGDVSIEVAPQSERDLLGNAFSQMVKYLQNLADGIDLLAANDLTVEVQSQSTLDRLGNAMRRMLVNLRDLVGQVQGNARQVAVASQQITMAAEQSADGTAQVASTVQQIAQSTAEQTNGVTNAIVIVDQVSRAIDSVARGAQEQAHSVARSAEITSEISQAIEQVTAGAQSGAQGAAHAAQTARDSAGTVEVTIRGMQSIKEKVDASAARVREMGRRSEEIGEIVATIDDIAAQTNLLALNAAIEAARAGEHGRGFSVVADEVRKLAESSGQATKEIAQLIRDIQRTVTEAVEAMNEGAREVDEGVIRAEGSRQALRDIVQIVEASGQQADEVAAAAEQMHALATEMTGAMDSVSAVVEENTGATEEMAAGAGEVSQAVENVASISEENSAATEEVGAVVEEVSAQAEEVKASAESLSTMAESLRTLVAQFKLPEN